MALKFAVLCATLAFANAGIISEPSYTSYAAVQPAVATYASAPAHSYAKTVTYSSPKAYVAPAQVAYQHYEPEHHYSAPVVATYHAPQTVYAAPHYEHGTSSQNIIRSAHGTVSQISKTVDTPHSSVRKYDTRIINDGYKTVSYAQPATYVAQPATTYIQPAVQKTYVSQPVVQKSYISQPVAYAQSAPVLAAKVHYSPAVEVAHTSYESPIAHYAW